MEKLLCRAGILFFYHFYRAILSEIERENERNILHYCAIFCPYYVIFFFSHFSFSFFSLFSPFFFFLFSFFTLTALFFGPHRTIFWSLPHYFPGNLVPEVPKLFPCVKWLTSSKKNSSVFSRER